MRSFILLKRIVPDHTVKYLYFIGLYYMGYSRQYRMDKYLDINGNSGVLANELGSDFIRVEFKNNFKVTPMIIAI